MSEILLHEHLLLLARTKGSFEIKLSTGPCFRLSSVWYVDPSIYNEDNRWSATVDGVSNVGDDVRRLFTIGSGIDFNEDEVSELTIIIPNEAQKRVREGRTEGGSL